MANPAASLANWTALSQHLSPQCLRIASYNVHSCVGTDGRKDAARIAQVIAELGCDTVGLQEVDYRLDYIALRLGMQPVPGLTPDEVAHITAYVRHEQRKAGIQ